MWLRETDKFTLKGAYRRCVDYPPDHRNRDED